MTGNRHLQLLGLGLTNFLTALTQRQLFVQSGNHLALHTCHLAQGFVNARLPARTRTLEIVQHFGR